MGLRKRDIICAYYVIWGGESPFIPKIRLFHSGNINKYNGLFHLKIHPHGRLDFGFRPSGK